MDIGREAFLNVTDNKILIEYDGGKVKYEWKKLNEFSDKILPTIGEYMDAKKGEYKEEIIKLKNMR